MPGKARHIPLRRCVVCRRQRPQAELLRFCRDPEGHWRSDPQGEAGGRGAWLCRDTPACQHVKNLRRFFRSEAVSVAAQLNAQTLTAEGG